MFYIQFRHTLVQYKSIFDHFLDLFNPDLVMIWYSLKFLVLGVKSLRTTVNVTREIHHFDGASSLQTNISSNEYLKKINKKYRKDSWNSTVSCQVSSILPTVYFLPTVYWVYTLFLKNYIPFWDIFLQILCFFTRQLISHPFIIRKFAWNTSGSPWDCVGKV